MGRIMMQRRPGAGGGLRPRGAVMGQSRGGPSAMQEAAQVIGLTSAALQLGQTAADITSNIVTGIQARNPPEAPQEVQQGYADAQMAQSLAQSNADLNRLAAESMAAQQFPGGPQQFPGGLQPFPGGLQQPSGPTLGLPVAQQAPVTPPPPPTVGAPVVPSAAPASVGPQSMEGPQQLAAFSQQAAQAQELPTDFEVALHKSHLAGLNGAGPEILERLVAAVPYMVRPAAGGGLMGAIGERTNAAATQALRESFEAGRAARPRGPTRHEQESHAFRRTEHIRRMEGMDAKEGRSQRAEGRAIESSARSKRGFNMDMKLKAMRLEALRNPEDNSVRDNYQTALRKSADARRRTAVTRMEGNKNKITHMAGWLEGDALAGVRAGLKSLHEGDRVAGQLFSDLGPGQSHEDIRKAEEKRKELQAMVKMYRDQIVTSKRVHTSMERAARAIAKARTSKELEAIDRRFFPELGEVEAGMSLPREE